MRGNEQSFGEKMSFSSAFLDSYTVFLRINDKHRTRLLSPQVENCAVTVVFLLIICVCANELVFAV